MQRSLAGQEIAPADRRTWIRYYRYGEGILATNTVGARMALGEIDEYALPRADLAGLRRALIALDASKPQFIYDLRTSMGLSTIMLSEKRGRAPAQACALGKYYMLAAKDTIPAMITANRFDQSDAARLRGYLQQLQARIDVSC
jgi:hypothetical protein